MAPFYSAQLPGQIPEGGSLDVDSKLFSEAQVESKSGFAKKRQLTTTAHRSPKIFAFKPAAVSAGSSL
jgi:hypothetical protein